MLFKRIQLTNEKVVKEGLCEKNNNGDSGDGDGLGQCRESHDETKDEDGTAGRTFLSSIRIIFLKEKYPHPHNSVYWRPTLWGGARKTL